MASQQRYHYVAIRLAGTEVRHVQFDGSLRSDGTALEVLRRNRRVRKAGESGYIRTAEGTLVHESAVVKTWLELDRDKPVKPIAEGDAATNV